MLQIIRAAEAVPSTAIASIASFVDPACVLFEPNHLARS